MYFISNFWIDKKTRFLKNILEGFDLFAITFVYFAYIIHFAMILHGFKTMQISIKN